MANRGMAGGLVTQDVNDAAKVPSEADKMRSEADKVPCPKCGVVMQLAAVLPHATDRRMAKHTYLCAPCNQTRNYMLPASGAERAG